ncbi:hypothetical protein [Pyrococcus kukulkanii]
MLRKKIPSWKSRNLPKSLSLEVLVEGEGGSYSKALHYDRAEADPSDP